MAIWYILLVIWYIFSILVCCTEKNLATLHLASTMTSALVEDGTGHEVSLIELDLTNVIFSKQKIYFSNHLFVF
jgi:hypothetical protein